MLLQMLFFTAAILLCAVQTADPRSHRDQSQPSALLRMCAHFQTRKHWGRECHPDSHATFHSEFHFPRRDPLDEEEICKFQP